MEILFYVLGALLVLSILAAAFVFVSFVVVLIAGAEPEYLMDHSRGEDFEDD